MAKSIKVNQNKRGRPATGRDPVSAVRLPPELTAEIDAWAAKSGMTSRSDAIRKLVEMGLAGSPQRARDAEAGAKAKSMAAQELDRVADRTASSEERETRKRRLLKGPSEFREIRRDRPKSKG